MNSRTKALSRQRAGLWTVDRVRIAALCAIGLSALLGSRVAVAANRDVPTVYASMNAACAACAAGDTVRVMQDYNDAGGNATVNAQTVIIDGQNHTVTVTAAAAAFITVNAAACGVQNLIINGNALGNGLISISAAGSASVGGCTVYGSAGNGLVNSGGNMYLTNCISRNNATNGMVNRGTLTLTNCQIYSNTSDGLRVNTATAATSSTVTNTPIYSNGQRGINVQSSATGGNTVIVNTNSIIRDNAMDGIRIESPNIAGGLATTLTVSNTTFQDNGAGGAEYGVHWVNTAGGNNSQSSTNAFTSCTFRQNNSTSLFKKDDGVYVLQVTLTDPVFSGKCGALAFDLGNGGTGAYSANGFFVQSSGSGAAKVDFDPMLTGGTQVIGRIRSGHLYFNKCRATVVDQAARYHFDCYGNGMSLPLTAGVDFDFNRCYFKNGAGSVRPLADGGAFAVHIVGNNCIWNWDDAAAYTHGPVLSLRGGQTVASALYLKHCTLRAWDTTNDLTTRLTEGNLDNSGNAVARGDVLYGGWSIFDSSGVTSAATNEASNLGLTQYVDPSGTTYTWTRCIAWRATGDSGFSSVPAPPSGELATSVNNPNLAATGYTQSTSGYALSKGKYSPNLTDIDGVSRPTPSGTNPDIGANELPDNDTTPPAASSMVRHVPTSQRTNAASVTWRVTFSESVTGVDTADFTITKVVAGDPITGYSVTSVSPVSASIYDVIVNTGSNDGTLRLDLKSSGTGIQDLWENAIGAGFAAGETYIIDKTPPVTTVSSPASSPTNASPIAFDVDFTESVIGFDQTDLIITNGSVNSFAGGGTHFDVDITPTGDGVVTVTVNAGAAQDAAGNNSTGPASYSVTSDRTPPHATSITPTTSSPTDGSTVTFSVTFDEAVQNFTNSADVIITPSGTVLYSGVNITGGAVTYTVTVTGVTGDGTIRLAASTGSDVRDLAGNALASSVTSNPVTMDHIRPNATVITPAGPNPTNGSVVTFTVHFDEAVQQFNNAGDLVITEPGVSHSGVTISGGPQDYTVDVTGVTGDGSIRLAVSTVSDVMDLATNALQTSASSTPVTVDHTPPRATIITPATPSPTNGSTVAFSVTFDEDVLSFNDVSDLAITETGTVAHSGVNVSGGPAVYTVTFTGVTGDGTIRLAASTVSDVHDSAMNPLASSVTSAAVTVDHTSSNAITVTPTTSSPANSATVAFSVTFDEDVQHFNDSADAIITETGSVGHTGVNVSGGPATYSVSVTGVTGEGTIRMAVSTASDVQDLAGNALASSVTSGAVTMDHVGPNATTIAPTSPILTNASTVSFAVHFDEAVQQFNNASDVAVTESGVSHTSVTIGGGPQDYTVDVTGVTGNGTIRLAVSTASDVADLATNALLSSVISSAVSVDQTPPHAVVVNPTTASPANGNVVNFTVQFDETVQNFGTGADVVVSETGTVAHTGVIVTGSGQDYSVQVTGVTGDGTMRLAVSTASDVQDLATNPVASSVTSSAVTLDHTGPSALGVVAQNPNPTNSGTVVYEVTFSEDVLNFSNASDVAVTPTGSVNYSGLNITGGPALYTVYLSGVAGDGTLRMAVNLASDIRDSASNGMASSVTSATLTVDQTAPTVTAITPAGPNPTPATSVPFTVQFDEPVQHFDAAADLVITATGSVTYGGAAISGGPQTYTVTVTGVVGNGTMALAASTGSDVKDLADNPLASSVSSAPWVEIDHVNPIVTVTPLTTNDTTPLLSGTVTDDVGVAGVTIVVDGNNYGSSVTGGNWTAQVTNALAEGTFDVRATATDTAGNTARDATANELVVDLTPPVVTVNPRYTSDTTPTISGTVTDAVGVASVDVTVDGHTYPASLGPGSWTATVTDALAPGVYDVATAALDMAGNPGNDATTNELTIDLNAPTVAVDALTTNDATPALTGTATAQPGHVINSVVVTVNGVPYAYTPAPPANNVAWAVTTALLADGVYDVAAEATDDLTRTGSDGTINELAVDTRPPTAMIRILGAPQTGADEVAFAVTFDEPVGSSFTVSDLTVTGTLSGTPVVTGADPAYTVTMTLANSDADGTVGISIGTAVTDAAGNAYAGGASPLYRVFNWRGFTTQPQFAQAYEGGSHLLRVVPDCGADTIAYQWQWDDGAKAIQNGPPTSTWLLPGLSAANRGTYWCEVTYDGVLHETTHATVSVEPHVQITVQPVGADKQPGESHTFSVVATGGYAPFSYQWRKNGAVIAGATNASYELASLTAGDTGVYAVDVTDAVTDAVTSDEAVLHVSGGMPVLALLGLLSLTGLLTGLGARAVRKK